MLKAKLVVVGGDAQRAEVELRLPLVVGRGRDVGLTVPHGLVSRRHCEIVENNGRLRVRDLGSLNGTFVNNHRIENEQELLPDQLLTLGNITFRAVYQIAESEAAMSASEFTTSTHGEPHAHDTSGTNNGKTQITSPTPTSSDSILQQKTIPVESGFAVQDSDTLPQDSPQEEESIRALTPLTAVAESAVHDSPPTLKSKTSDAVVFESVEPVQQLVKPEKKPNVANDEESLADLGLDDDDEFSDDSADSAMGSFLRNRPR